MKLIALANDGVAPGWETLGKLIEHPDEAVGIVKLHERWSDFGALVGKPLELCFTPTLRRRDQTKALSSLGIAGLVCKCGSSEAISGVPVGSPIAVEPDGGGDSPWSALVTRPVWVMERWPLQAFAWAFYCEAVVRGVTIVGVTTTGWQDPSTWRTRAVFWQAEQERRSSRT